MKKLKKHGAVKAFTLVELIVVMVILAILAALMLPSLTKYIDKANDQSMLVEARYALTAIQTYASEEYGRNKSTGITLQNKINEEELAPANREKSDIYAMAECPGTISNVVVEGSKITGFTYTDKGNLRKVIWSKDAGFSDVEDVRKT